MKSIQLDDLKNYTFLSNIEYAPGGEAAAFVAARADLEENEYERYIWLYEKGGVRRLTGLGKEGSFTWLDSTHLMFSAVRSAAEKKRQESKDPFTSFYRIDIHGGEAEPFFTLPFQAGAVKVLDESHFAVTGYIFAAHPDFYCAEEAERKRILKEVQDEADYEVFDELPFWFNGGGVINKKRNAIFLVSLEDDGGNHKRPKVMRVTEPLENADSLEILGDEILFLSETYRTDRPVRGLCVKAVNGKTGALRVVAEDPALSPGGMKVAGDVVYLMATSGERHGLNENNWVYTLDPEKGSIRLLRQEEFNMYGDVGSDCRLGGGAVWMAKGRSLYHITTREGNAVLYRLDPDGSSHPVCLKEGSIDAIAVCEEKEEILLIALYDMKLQELYVLENPGKGENEAPRRITCFNEEALKDRYVAEPKYLETESEGYTIGGWVLLPKDFDPDQTYPAVFDIHGGPKTVYGPVFYHEMQLWASEGYFVFFCNPKGSDGRDSAFQDIRGEYGQTDYRNLMDFADAVLKAYPQIDPSRVCETGGSYGGFMTNWIIGHTDRFCCAASQRSISNWISFSGVSDIGPLFSEDQTAGDPFDSPEKMWEQSPLKYAAQVKTPTLFIHSDQDYRCPLDQGLQMYTALVKHGIPARLCLFHGENHELSRSGKPKHRIRRLQEITEWFKTYSGKK